MEKIPTTLSTLKQVAPILHYGIAEFSAILSIKKGKITAHMTVFRTPEKAVLLNISDAVTFKFETENEYENFMAEYADVCDSEKEMLMKLGMSEEALEEWNNESTEN